MAKGVVGKVNYVGPAKLVSEAKAADSASWQAGTGEASASSSGAKPNAPGTHQGGKGGSKPIRAKAKGKRGRMSPLPPRAPRRP
tara:strand:+ start:6315 stop:6566 length:252 start_codon:yes stop_codon:yes gene_type:complete